MGRKPSPKTQKPTAEEKAKQHEISEFLDDLRELGIGEARPARERTQTPVDSKPLDPSAEVPVPSAVQRMAAEWVPLNLSYGIPLFNERANQAVCDKVGHNITGYQHTHLLSSSPSLPPPSSSLPSPSSLTAPGVWLVQGGEFTETNGVKPSAYPRSPQLHQ